MSGLELASPKWSLMHTAPSAIAFTVAAALVPTLVYILHRCRISIRKIDVHPHLACQTEVIDEVEGIRTSSFCKRPLGELSVRNVYGIFLKGLSTSRNEPCLGIRPPNQPTYQWQTYAQVEERVLSLGSAIDKHFHENSQNIVGIMAKNRPEWVITQLASAAYGHVLVPIYSTLGNEACQHILRQTEMNLVFCETIGNLEQIMSLEMSYLKCAVVMKPEARLTELQAQYADKLRITTFAEFEAYGGANKQPTKIVDPSSLYMICYTSGSTGIPKGAMISHEEFCAQLHANTFLSDIQIPIDKTSVHLSYLPLAHVMEQIVMSILLFKGARSAFLSKDITGLMEDAQVSRPTFLCVVPRIIERLYQEYMKKLRRINLLMRSFDYAMYCREEEKRQGAYRVGTIMDKLFFRPVREKWGGSVKFIICGSAALPKQHRTFAESVFACSVFEGYGATEFSGAITCTLVGDFIGDRAGALMPGVQVKLVDVPDMNIVAARDDKGEIYVKCRSGIKGYFKDPERTNELIDGDWIRTGDIGSWAKDGALMVVDRCKNVFKLSIGEYVAPLKLEQVYEQCQLVSQAFVDGDSSKSYLVAVVVPHMQELRRALGQLNESETTSSSKYADMTGEQICTLPAANKLVLADMVKVGRCQNLKSFELVKAVHLRSTHFTVENQLLTPTLKLARPRLRREFAKTLEQLYGAGKG